jgi:hypothetical protein
MLRGLLRYVFSYNMKVAGLTRTIDKFTICSYRDDLDRYVWFSRVRVQQTLQGPTWMMLEEWQTTRVGAAPSPPRTLTTAPRWPRRATHDTAPVSRQPIASGPDRKAGCGCLAVAPCNDCS